MQELLFIERVCTDTTVPEQYDGNRLGDKK